VAGAVVEAGSSASLDAALLVTLFGMLVLRPVPVALVGREAGEIGRRHVALGGVVGRRVRVLDRRPRVPHLKEGHGLLAAPELEGLALLVLSQQRRLEVGPGSDTSGLLAAARLRARHQVRLDPALEPVRERHGPRAVGPLLHERALAAAKLEDQDAHADGDGLALARHRLAQCAVAVE
jgi:hypothetical protein